MAMILAVGFISSKRGMVSTKTAKELGGIFVEWITPCVIINAFQIEYSKERINGLIWTIVLSFLANFLVVCISSIFWRGKKFKIERLAMIYTNASFMGIPLVMAVFGSEGVFYASIFVCVFQMFFWSHGVSTIDEEISLASVKKILLSPAFLSCIVGMIMFLARIQLPTFISSTIKYISDMNTPLAMIIAGVTVANTPLKGIWKDKKLYIISFCKLVIAPLCVALLFSFIPTDSIIKETIVLQLACPVAVTIGVVMEQRGLYEQSGTVAKYFVASTAFSVLSIPFVYTIAKYIMTKSF